MLSYIPSKHRHTEFLRLLVEAFPQKDLASLASLLSLPNTDTLLRVFWVVDSIVWQQSLAEFLRRNPGCSRQFFQRKIMPWLRDRWGVTTNYNTLNRFEDREEILHIIYTYKDVLLPDLLHEEVIVVGEEDVVEGISDTAGDGGDSYVVPIAPPPSTSTVSPYWREKDNGGDAGEYWRNYDVTQSLWSTGWHSTWQHTTGWHTTGWYYMEEEDGAGEWDGGVSFNKAH
jgi:hypothetical protein